MSAVADQKAACSPIARGKSISQEGINQLCSKVDLNYWTDLHWKLLQTLVSEQYSGK